MAQELRQATTVTLKVGPFLDPTDGVTPETGLSPAIEVAKNGGAFAARNSATAVAHDAEGWYDVEVDTTDTGSLGRFVVKAIDSSNHVPVWHEFMILRPEVWDQKYGALAGTGVVRSATAQGGGASTITLDASASSTDDIYNDLFIAIIAGTGAGQLPRAITDYVQSTKVATIDPPWDTQPDSTSEFIIFR